MKPAHLHIHLEANDIKFWELTNDFDHSVYYNPETRLKFTFPIKVVDIDDELVSFGCTYLGASVPIEVEENLRNKPSDAEGGNS